MSRKWFFRVDVILAGFAGILLMATISIALSRPSEIPVIAVKAQQKTLPKGAFVFSKKAYDAIAEDLLYLKFSPPTMQLPNLRTLLIYFGPNGRPDASKDAVSLHFGIGDAKSQASIAPDEPLYLLYDRQQNPPRYVFSPNNTPTSLWIYAQPKGNDATIHVMMKNENGEKVQEPADNAEFSLQQKEFHRYAGGSGNNWELGKWRVDGTLLSRQHARWYGPDRFLEKHGGEEYNQFVNKQRIDFGEGDEVYSIYVGPDDALVWDQDHWKIAKAGKETQGHPLMQLKKIDERLLSFVLWDADGKNRLNLNLLKSNEQWIPKNLQQDFKFLAARTRSQYVFEINKERMLLQPKDWLLLTDNGWKKLSTEQDIDDYVDRKVTGPLFVFDGIVKKDDKQMLVGTLFNASRTEMQPIELDLSQNNMTIIAVPKDKPNTPQTPHAPNSTHQATQPPSAPHLPIRMPVEQNIHPQLSGNTK